MSGDAEWGPSASTGARLQDTEESCAVQVAVHIRPLIGSELQYGCEETLSVTPGTSQIRVAPNTFSYDFAFGSNGGSPANTLYDRCVQPLVHGLFKGYNATVFAYGQTGSGKTYTMGSTLSSGTKSKGVIPNVIESIYSNIQARHEAAYTVRVGYVEIHQEVIRDLLAVDTVPGSAQPEVVIREVAGGGVCLAGAREVEVGSREELSQVLQQGSLLRATAATGMNHSSSRSHAVFTITLEQRRQVSLQSCNDEDASEEGPLDSQQPKIGSSGNGGTSDGDTVEEYLSAKMHLVDLAGSERLKRTRAEGARLAEGISINRGLFALGNVINALSSQGSQPAGAPAAARHVPYRDSKLTRMLQDSLGGNSRTVMIACVSPADVNLEESVNTLRYAARARHIRNKPIVNHDPNAAQVAVLRQQLAASRAEAAALRRALQGRDHGRHGDSGAPVASEQSPDVLPQAEQDAENEAACLRSRLEEAKHQLEEARQEVREERRGRAEDQACAEMLHQRLRQLDPDCPEHMAVDVVAANRLATIAQLTSELRQLQTILATQQQASTSPGVSWRSSSGSDGEGEEEADMDVDQEDGNEEADVHRQEQAALQRQLQELDARHEARLAEVAALAEGAGRVAQIKTQYDRTVAALASERDALQAERAALLQKMAAVESAGLEERERLRATYRTRLKDMDTRLKALAARAIAAQQAAKLQARSEATCERLKSDIAQIRQQKVQLLRQIEKSQKEFAAAQHRRETEIMQLRRKGLRAEAAMAKQGHLLQRRAAVLRRKLEHADASRARLERLEVARRHRGACRPPGQAAMAAGSSGGEEDCQPCAAAPLLRDEAARRSWVDSELAACCMAQDLRRILEGEVAARSAAVARLREVEKAAAAADVPTLVLSPAPSGTTPITARCEKPALDKRRASLQADVDSHSKEIARIMASLVASRGEEESRGGGAADVRRWTAVRTTVQARAMLRTVFRAAADNAAQVLELETTLAEEKERSQLARLRLYIASASQAVEPVVNREGDGNSAAAAAAAAAAQQPQSQHSQDQQLPVTEAVSGEASDHEVASLMAAIEMLAPCRQQSDGMSTEHVTTPTARQQQSSDSDLHQSHVQLLRDEGPTPEAASPQAIAENTSSPTSTSLSETPSMLPGRGQLAANVETPTQLSSPESQISRSPGADGARLSRSSSSAAESDTIDLGNNPPLPAPAAISAVETAVDMRSSQLPADLNREDSGGEAFKDAVCIISLSDSSDDDKVDSSKEPCVQPHNTEHNVASIADSRSSSSSLGDGSSMSGDHNNGEKGGAVHSVFVKTECSMTAGKVVSPLKTASPQRRRASRRLTTRWRGPPSMEKGRRRSRGTAGTAPAWHSKAEKERMLLASINAARAAVGNLPAKRLTMRAIATFMNGKIVGGRRWVPRTKRRTEMICDALHYLGWGAPTTTATQTEPPASRQQQPQQRDAGSQGRAADSCRPVRSSEWSAQSQQPRPPCDSCVSDILPSDAATTAPTRVALGEASNRLLSPPASSFKVSSGSKSHHGSHGKAVSSNHAEIHENSHPVDRLEWRLRLKEKPLAGMTSSASNSTVTNIVAESSTASGGNRHARQPAWL